MLCFEDLCLISQMFLYLSLLISFSAFLLLHSLLVVSGFSHINHLYLPPFPHFTLSCLFLVKKNSWAFSFNCLLTFLSSIITFLKTVFIFQNSLGLPEKLRRWYWECSYILSLVPYVDILQYCDRWVIINELISILIINYYYFISIYVLVTCYLF
jgi:hypothetical protein